MATVLGVPVLVHSASRVKTHCKFGLHISQFWTPRFSVWTTHFGWTRRLKYEMVQKVVYLCLFFYSYVRKNRCLVIEHDVVCRKHYFLLACTYLDHAHF